MAAFLELQAMYNLFASTSVSTCASQPASQQTKIEICAQSVAITTLPLSLWTIP